MEERMKSVCRILNINSFNSIEENQDKRKFVHVNIITEEKKALITIGKLTKIKTVKNYAFPDFIFVKISVCISPFCWVLSV